MKKIPSLYERDWDGDPSYVTRNIHEGSEWVLEGLGIATRKFDGTCVCFDGPEGWFARREVKKGKTTPENFRSLGVDPETGKEMGWEPADQSGWYKFLLEAISNLGTEPWPDTYELVGPKINGNPENFSEHRIIPHGIEPVGAVPTDWDQLRHWLYCHPYEGVVWHHPDGRMVKIKKKDFPEL